VSLNAEQPVEVERLFASYFGVVLPIFVAAIVRRLFLPIPPESELRKRLIEFFQSLRTFWQNLSVMGRGLSSRLTLIPMEAANRVRGLQGRNCPETEVEKLLRLTVATKSRELIVRFMPAL
jgi:hypothetical protein